MNDKWNNSKLSYSVHVTYDIIGDALTDHSEYFSEKYNLKWLVIKTKKQIFWPLEKY